MATKRRASNRPATQPKKVETSTDVKDDDQNAAAERVDGTEFEVGKDGVQIIDQDGTDASVVATDGSEPDDAGDDQEDGDSAPQEATQASERFVVEPGEKMKPSWFTVHPDNKDVLIAKGDVIRKSVPNGFRTPIYQQVLVAGDEITKGEAKKPVW